MKRRRAKCHPNAQSAARVGLLCTAALAVAPLLAGCGSAIASPKLGPHYQEEPLAVPYPPPPARVETIPRHPREMKNPVWLDGEWQWKGRRWVWQEGHWELPLAGGYYAPATTLRIADGTLYYYQGEWKRPLPQR